MNLERNRLLQPLIPLEKISENRLYPMRIARQYLSGGTPLVNFNPENNVSNAPALTNPEKEEKIALEGILINWMTSQACKMKETRPPYGLIYFDNGLDGDLSDKNAKIVKDANLLGEPFTTFPFAILHTFALSLEEKRKQIFATPNTHEATIYNKYLGYFHRNGTRPDDQDGIKSIVFSSIFALRMMTDILAHSSEIDSTPLERKVTFDEAANAARNSTPLITKLSSLEDNVFVTVNNTINNGGIWKSLEIVEYAKNIFYQIKDPILKNAISRLSEPEIKEKIGKNSRAGCPARLRFDGDKSAIETLWNWYIDFYTASQNK
jgi:hypothetical protein